MIRNWGIAPLVLALLPFVAAQPTNQDLATALKDYPVETILLEEAGSAQAQAAKWLLEEDSYWQEAGLGVESPGTLYRYALATLFFATGGEDSWNHLWFQ